MDGGRSGVVLEHLVLAVRQVVEGGVCRDGVRPVQLDAPLLVLRVAEDVCSSESGRWSAIARRREGVRRARPRTKRPEGEEDGDLADRAREVDGETCARGRKQCRVRAFAGARSGLGARTFPVARGVGRSKYLGPVEVVHGGRGQTAAGVREWEEREGEALTRCNCPLPSPCTETDAPA